MLSLRPYGFNISAQNKSCKAISSPVNSTISRNSLAFKGDFFAIADSHSRTDRCARHFTKIEEACANKKETIKFSDGSTAKAVVFDCGDILGGNLYSLDCAVNIYKDFAKKNKDIKLVVSLGNVDTDYCNENNAKFINYIKSMNNAGITILSENANVLKVPELKGLVKTSVSFEQNGEKFLVYGTTTDGRSAPDIVLSSQQKSIDKYLMPAIEKEKPDKIIFLSHNFLDKTNELQIYMEKIKQIDNISMVIGGHPHDKVNRPITIYPEGNCRGMYDIGYNDGNFKVDDYLIYKNLKAMSEHYESRIEKANIEDGLNVEIAKLKFDLPSRITGKPSCPTERGTFVANSIKKLTNANFALLMSQDLRDDFPSKGEAITKYDVKNTVNADKELRIIEVNADQLKEIFEISLNNQFEYASNSDFLEYSSNLKIERDPTLAKGEKEKVKQIFVKGDDGKWIGLLDGNGKAIHSANKYSLAVCTYLIGGTRKSLDRIAEISNEKDSSKLSNVRMLRDIPEIKGNQELINIISPDSKELPDRPLTTLDCFYAALFDEDNLKAESYAPSEMVDVEKEIETPEKS